MGNRSIMKIASIVAVLGAASGWCQAQGQGPGVPRIEFPAAEVGTALWHSTEFTDRVPFALMFKGYLVISQFRGRTLKLYDISNPRAPRKVSEVSGGGQIGDEHTIPQYGNRLVAGGHVYDFTNPLAPRFVGGHRGHYLSVCPTFQYPYMYETRVYSSDQSSQLSIIDFSNPAAVRVVKRINVSSIVGFATGSTYVIGNLLIVTSGDRFSGVATFDISDPLNPRLLATFAGGHGMYMSQIYGSYIITTGPVNEGKISVFDFKDPENLTRVMALDRNPLPGMGDYAHFQNGIMYGGSIFQENFIKADINDNFKVLLNRKTGNRTSRYVIPFGNMLLVGDHANSNAGSPGSHAALFVHDSRPDSIGPSVLYVNPPNGAMNQALTSRIGLALDENVDTRDLDAGRVMVRPAGGQPLAGQWTHSLGVANFTPAQPLVRGLTYEVVMPAGVLKDWMGNSNPREFLSRFSTGGTLAAIVPGRAQTGGVSHGPRLMLHLVGGRLDLKALGIPAFDLRGSRLQQVGSMPMLLAPSGRP